MHRDMIRSLLLVFAGCAVTPYAGEPATESSPVRDCVLCDAEAVEAYTRDKTAVTEQALQYINGVAGYLRSTGTISDRRKEAATSLFFDMLALVRWLQLRPFSDSDIDHRSSSRTHQRIRRRDVGAGSLERRLGRPQNSFSVSFGIAVGASHTCRGRRRDAINGSQPCPASAIV
jgi:hypothetical protein